MKLSRYILVVVFILAGQFFYLFGQNTNSGDTISFNKHNLDNKNMIKFSGLFLHGGDFIAILLTVGYEKALNERYSTEIVYGGIVYGGEWSFGIHSLHWGVKYYFSTTNFKKSKHFLNPYCGLFVRYQRISVHSDRDWDKLANGYGVGGGLGTVMFLTKKLFLECGYFAYYSYRGIGQTFSKHSDSAILNSGFRYNPRLCLGINF